MPDLPHAGKKKPLAEEFKRDDFAAEIRRQRRHEADDTFEHVSRPLSRVLKQMAANWEKRQ